VFGNHVAWTGRLFDFRPPMACMIGHNADDRRIELVDFAAERGQTVTAFAHHL